MTCYHPLKAYRLETKNPKTGKNWICFKPTKGIIEHLQVPCGQCSGCKLERSRIWAIRCMHELQSHTHNQYVTLTYNNKNLPQYSSLKPEDIQLFFKRLRKHFPPKSIRHYSCGEYGEECGVCEKNKIDCRCQQWEPALGRPHYHTIIFGLKLNDLQYYQTTNQGHKLYNSKFLEDIWGNGNVIIGDVSFESCAYVARYIMKKITGEQEEKHYYIETDYATQQDISLEREFTRMSNRPGISSEWYNKYKNDIYNNNVGTVTIRGGIQTKPPRFYEDKFELEEPERHKIIKQRRKDKAIINQSDNTPERLAVKEKVLNKKIKQLIRTLE